ncbi:hypothetical protein TDMWS_02850 [Thermodesulfomicrobium sp. WS]|jgi:hypothetical protein|uniref:hypothetical protein n=1 Tax=Thermodesulfomicrobium sp. WS TaxID=3004129 RepID=UPI00249020E5|nr:hypothetical protein [Thermodesulfomicrobium sp. WS]BDV00200.1 hypothetical protein TDMWS_02850 [Thermodesulfomicrobium sp. WS]
MAKPWVIAKRPLFVRDVVRDFCLAAARLESHFHDYDRTGAVSFSFFDDILGRQNSKGLLWRLKDSAHLLFRDEGSEVLGEYLDWALGYIFHECIKLKEDAYQQMNYKPRFENLQQRQDLSPEEQHLGGELFAVISQTSESIRREVQRVRFILFHCKRMFIRYLPRHADNPLLARLFYLQWQLLEQAFRSYTEELLQAMYGSDLSRLYLLAAESLEAGGWEQEAAAARMDAAHPQWPPRHTLDEGRALAAQRREQPSNPIT